VEGVNIVSKSTKPSAKNPQGGIIKQEAPIHISNLSLIDPKSGKPTRIGIKKMKMVKKFVTLKNQGRKLNNEYSKLKNDYMLRVSLQH
jgi:large subunit ribosomal protein L24